MPRYCLLGHVDPNRLDEYRRSTARSGRSCCEALRDAGWRNYSLFLRDDGLLIGYAEADDLAAAQERVARTEVNARWQTAMSTCSRPTALPTKPGRSSPRSSISKINFERRRASKIVRVRPLSSAANRAQSLFRVRNGPRLRSAIELSGRVVPRRLRCR